MLKYNTQFNGAKRLPWHDVEQKLKLFATLCISDPDRIRNVDPKTDLGSPSYLLKSKQYLSNTNFIFSWRFRKNRQFFILSINLNLKL
jgi:hypothetical protein